jgi:hypothetical protein
MEELCQRAAIRGEEACSLLTPILLVWFQRSIEIQECDCEPVHASLEGAGAGFVGIAGRALDGGGATGAARGLEPGPAGAREFEPMAPPVLLLRCR